MPVRKAKGGINSKPWFPPEEGPPPKVKKSLKVLVLGEKVFIQTPTWNYIGVIQEINAESVILDPCAWVADAGVFHVALTSGRLKEVEVLVDRAEIFRPAMIAATPWRHDIPKESSTASATHRMRDDEVRR